MNVLMTSTGFVAVVLTTPVIMAVARWVAALSGQEVAAITRALT